MQILYDLGKDPLEWRNVAEDNTYATVLPNLQSRLDKWMEYTGDFLRGAKSFVG